MQARKFDSPLARTCGDRFPRGRMVIGPIFLALAIAVVSVPVSSQTKMLKGKEVTQAALINALDPPPGSRSIGEGKKPAQPVLIEFETNSTELTAEAKQTLDVIGQALNSDRLTKFKFVLEGHADPRGTSEWNQRLSEGRAESVLQYLVQNQSVAETRLSAVGKGDREPMNVQNPAAPENRRVTIVNITGN